MAPISKSKSFPDPGLSPVGSCAWVGQWLTVLGLLFLKGASPSLFSEEDKVWQVIDPVGVQQVVEVEKPPSGKLYDEEGNTVEWSLSTGFRTYHSTNVTRVSDAEQTANVMEFNIGANAVFPKIKLDIFNTQMTPRMSLLGLRSYFGRYRLRSADWRQNDAQILDYEFRLASLSTDIEALGGVQLSLGIEYDELLNFREGNRLYHALVPSVALSKILALDTGQSILLEAQGKYVSSHTNLPYEIPGVFDDDGDNQQLALNASLIQPIDEEGKMLVVPSISIVRTGYLNNLMTGRTDYLFVSGVSASYQAKPWFTPQLFVNHSKKWTNQKGKDILGAASKFKNLDAGLILSLSHSF